MEKERGIAGYTDTQDKLEMISASKGETDEKKGQILEDMSDMVRMGDIVSYRLLLFVVEATLSCCDCYLFTIRSHDCLTMSVLNI